MDTEEKNKGGRPLLFKDEKELQKKIDEYFAYCDKGRSVQVVYKGEPIDITKKIPYTITGLASFLGTNRQTLINYTNKEQFFDTVKRAKEKIESNYEENALMGESNPTFSIFTMKNNFEWKDKNETEHSGTIDTGVVILPERKK